MTDHRGRRDRDGDGHGSTDATGRRPRAAPPDPRHARRRWPTSCCRCSGWSIASTKTHAATCSPASGCGSPTTSQLLSNIRETLHPRRRRLPALAAQHPLVRRWSAPAGPRCSGRARRLRVRQVPVPRATGAMFSLVLGAIMVPTTALAIPTYLLFAQVGLVNTPWAIILPSLVSPFGLYLMRVYAAGRRPGQLIEAARIDGAGEFRIFFQIALRMLAPGHGDGAAVHARRDLEQLLPAADHAQRPGPVPDHRRASPPGPSQAQRRRRRDQRHARAGRDRSLLSIVPLVVAFLLLQRYWQSRPGHRRRQADDQPRPLPPFRRSASWRICPTASSSAPRTTTSTSRYERLEQTDLDLMAEAHFTVIRVGESVWSTWEPENGRFDLDWLQPVLDGAHERGIAVVLGTPTYAVPPWLARQYPEIAGERRDRAAHRLGRPPGGRLHPPRVPVPRRAGHPQDRRPVRRPPGGHRLPGRQRARAASSATTTASSSASSTTCAHTYGDVETLNREWGLVYWSHRLSTWADLWTPDGNAQPQYDLAWRRVPGRPDHRVHRLAGRHRPRVRPARTSSSPPASPTTGPALDDDELTGRLDVTAGNPYYAMQDGLALPDRRRPTPAALDDHRRLGAVPERGPDVLLAQAAVPGHRDQRAVHRRARGTTAPPTTASGGRPPGRWSRAARG